MCGVVNHVVVDGLVADGEYQFLGGFHGLGPVHGQLLEHLVAAGFHGIDIVTDDVYEAVFLSLLGGEYFGGDEVPPGLALADGAHHVGADHGRNQAELHFAEAEAGFLGGDDDVAAGGKAHRAAESGALYQADHGLGQVVEYVHQPRQFPGIIQVFLAAVLGHAAHPAKVGPGGEVLAFGAQDNDLHAVVGIHLGEGADQLLDDHVVEGVAFVRAVENHLGNAFVATFEQNCGFVVCHVSLPDYIRNTPKRVGLAGRLRVADRLRATTSRVWAGSITPSSQRRALA